jgi:hypothetical protein
VILEVQGLIPESDLVLDGVPFTAPSTDQLAIATSPGVHTIAVNADVDVDGVHGAFIEWSDANPSATRTLQLEEDTTLGVVYQTQYYVEVQSPYGSTVGTGWYDADSPLEPTIHPPTDPQQFLAFQYWTDGNRSYGVGEPIRVSSPMTIHAVWVKGEQSNSVSTFSMDLLGTSILIFAAMLILNVRLTRKQRTV